MAAKTTDPGPPMRHRTLTPTRSVDVEGDVYPCRRGLCGPRTEEHRQGAQQPAPERRQPMTQQPLGHEPAAPGPLDEPGPGRPTSSRSTNKEHPSSQSSSIRVRPSSNPSRRFPMMAVAPTPETSRSRLPMTSGAPPARSAPARRWTPPRARRTRSPTRRSTRARRWPRPPRTEAENVAAETKQQAASLLDTVRSEVGAAGRYSAARGSRRPCTACPRSWAAWRPARRSPVR